MKIALWLLLGSFAAMAQDGAELFRNHCSTCHRAGSSTSAPLPEALRNLPAQTILAALESGKMRAQGALLNAGERKLVADYLGTNGAQTLPASASCRGPAGARQRRRVHRTGRCRPRRIHERWCSVPPAGRASGC